MNGCTRRTGNDLDRRDHIDHIMSYICRYGMLCRIYVVQIQPWKHVLGHSNHPTLTRRHDLYVMQIIQISDRSTLKYIDHG